LNITQRAIDIAGGIDIVGARIGVSRSTVFRWGVDNRFKASKLQALCDMANKNGGDFAVSQFKTKRYTRARK